MIEPDGDYVVFYGIDIVMRLTPECPTAKTAYEKLCAILDPRTQPAISEYSTEHSEYAVGTDNTENPATSTRNLWPKP